MLFAALVGVGFLLVLVPLFLVSEVLLCLFGSDPLKRKYRGEKDR